MHILDRHVHILYELMFYKYIVNLLRLKDTKIRIPLKLCHKINSLGGCRGATHAYPHPPTPNPDFGTDFGQFSANFELILDFFADNLGDSFGLILGAIFGRF
jgi:hypothetical protein